MNILKHKKKYLIFSLILILIGLFFIITGGIKLGIDFTGGSIIRFNKVKGLNSSQIVESYKKQNQSVTVSETDKFFVVKSKPIETGVNAKVVEDLKKKHKDLRLESFETVGPVVGQETTKKAFFSILVSTLAIMLYISYSFKNIPKPYSSFKFGFSAILAMLHDSLLLVGFFAILGKFFNVEIDSLFITALLTVIGFSVHDTIVVFDRIRENLGKISKNYSFEEIANFSLVETVDRSLVTSLTVLITLFSLYVLGGTSIQFFTLALLFGIVSGTYSSIFIATPLLVIWENFSFKDKINK